MTFDSDAPPRSYLLKGVSAPWYQPRDLTEVERQRYRAISDRSRRAKALAESEGAASVQKIPNAKLNPEKLMPQLASNGLSALSLFSGGGGLDIGFDRAGYGHVASFDILDQTGIVLGRAKPDWTVHSGAAGDVTSINWRTYRGTVDVLHGGPPCQPFSHAGRQLGANDVRDMVPEMVRAIIEMQPRAFVLENVSGLFAEKFRDYLANVVYQPLDGLYTVNSFRLEAADFGVPQRRKRVFFVGFRSKHDSANFIIPAATHSLNGTCNLPQTLGARAALGLPDLGVDGLAPTIRSGLTGPRHTTSIVNSATAARHWAELGIWPNGVAKNRAAAAKFPTPNGAFRLSVADCMILQGFPTEWPILDSAVYKALGLLGNSVAPPMGYAVAKSVAAALIKR